MQFLCSTAFRKHMIVSSVAILAIFSTYPSYAEPLYNPSISPSSSIPTNDHIILAFCAFGDVRSVCMKRLDQCTQHVGRDRRGLERCYHELAQCRERAGC